MLRRLPALVATLFLTTVAAAQPGSGPMRRDLPSSDAGRAAAALLAEFNAGSLSDPRWMRWRQLVGRVEIGGVEEIARGGARVWV